MSAFVNTRKQSSQFRIDALFSRASHALTEWNDRRATRNALSRLSDRELEDIGLTRGEIDAVARKG